MAQAIKEQVMPDQTSGFAGFSLWIKQNPRKVAGVAIFFACAAALTYYTVRGSQRMHDELTEELSRRVMNEMV